MVQTTAIGAIANALMITLGLFSIGAVQSMTCSGSECLPERAIMAFGNQENTSWVVPKHATDSLTAIEQEIFVEINNHRDRQSLSPLELDEFISEQARQHSQAMAAGQVPFSHDRFDQRIDLIAQRIPYGGAAENVAFNQGYSNPVVQTINGWLGSPGHRQNIEGEYNLTGVGVATGRHGDYYVTQIFVRLR